MSVAVGTRLGSYEIVSALGAGGMGEVYRARDTQLGRDVALKILPGAFADDPDRVARFRREAQLLASLNHPHIGSIYGLEDLCGVPVLVLELIEGPTLGDRLMQGPIPCDEALAIGRQIADALEAAHEQGVVHRDLKPANIKIRPDGTVKVLDFGIAKSLGREGVEAERDERPTVPVTRKSVLIGTVAYMSPEQTRGHEVTRRSDVWAFGAVLFEMLTGKRPFTGATESDVIAAILRATPDWSTLPPETPPAITRLVQRCLERDPKARVHDIGDARLEIEDAEKALRAGTQLNAAVPPDGRIARARLSRRLLIASAITIGLAAIVAAAYLLGTRRGPGAAAEVRLQMAPPAGTHFVSVPAVSPDGRQIAFVAMPDAGGPPRLWLRPLAATTASQLAGTEGASYPFWSSDSRSVAFFADGSLKRLDLPAGGPIVVCAAAVGRGGLWLDDDTIVFAPTQFSPLMRVSAAGGQPAPLTKLAEDETGHRFPQRLPGRHFLYFSVNRTPDKSGTRLISIDAPDQPLNFFASGGAAEYLKGSLLFAPRSSSTSLLAQRLTLPSGQLAGSPIELGRVRVSETMGRYVTSTAPTGVVAFMGPPEAIGQFSWMGRDGRPLETVGAAEAQLGVELSPDRRQLATERARDIWTLDLARPVPSRMIRGSARHPLWSPDGTRIAWLFQGRGIGTFDIMATSVTTGVAEPLFQSNTGMVKPMGWTSDGETLIFTRSETGTEIALWTMPITEPQKAAPYLKDGAQNLEARLSPDGKWIAYATDRSGRFEVEVRSFPSPGARHTVSFEGGGYPKWRADGRELYFLSANSHLMAVRVTPGDPPVFSRPESLFEVKLVNHPDRVNFAAYGYDVNADGTRFLVNRLVSDPVTSMTIIVDWTPER